MMKEKLFKFGKNFLFQIAFILFQSQMQKLNNQHLMKALLPQMVQKGNDISAPLTKTVNIASPLSSKGFSDVKHEDIEELLWEESLNDKKLVLIDKSISNTFEEENTDNESVSTFSYYIKKGWN
ncbi:hypothetical protein NPIL_143991 [Nephila pilipes]|uniref:Uncharacterized protein n=1 Tax=Nephila pilipes TaxID=299642 RepID=A0A8X6MPI8_NEPPI|nr:hypothetical protein NPIL_143991 [Nephila pilipes]